MNLTAGITNISNLKQSSQVCSSNWNFLQNYYMLRDLGSETAVLGTKAAVYEYRSRFVSNIVLLQN
jgi:hypothetical protein